MISCNWGNPQSPIVMLLGSSMCKCPMSPLASVGISDKIKLTSLAHIFWEKIKAKIIFSSKFQSDLTLLSRAGKFGYCCGCGLVTSCGTGLVFGRTQFSLFNNPAQQLHPAFDQCCLIRFWSNLTPQRALINCHWEWTKGQVRAVPQKSCNGVSQDFGMEWNHMSGQYGRQGVG